ncbi:MAG TPA: glycosyltransferase [Thermoanaerobaculia bacterium]|nr:glycosyltransferase [Thermoanaerobaculia bacterium]
MIPAEPLVTLIVVPRERFGVALRSLESIYADTHFPFRLIYVDAGSPPAVSRALAARAQARGFELLRVDPFLAQNEARNLVLLRVQTRYVAFLDNDILVAPGWLEALVRCAEETGADLVGPLYMVGEPPGDFVHMAGGTVQIEEAGGRRRLVESHLYAGRKLPDIPVVLRRQQTELLEFHCLLARTACLQSLGPLDERYLSTGEHIDLCLAVRARGGTVYFEPEARISYLPPKTLDPADLPFFRLRWSEAWTKASFSRLRERWDLAEDSPYFEENLLWMRSHRRLPLAPVQRALQRLLGRRLARYPLMALALYEVALNRWLIRNARRPRSP